MGIKSKNECNLARNVLSIKRQLLDIDKELSYFLGRFEDGDDMFDLSGQDPITLEAQEKIDRINPKFDSINVEYKFTVTEKIVEGRLVTDFPFINLNSLDYALNDLDEENQSDVLTAQCAPAYKPLYKILMNFFFET